MKSVSYSEFRKYLKTYLDETYEKHEPMVITRKRSKDMIVMSLDDYNYLVKDNDDVKETDRD